MLGVGARASTSAVTLCQSIRHGAQPAARISLRRIAVSTPCAHAYATTAGSTSAAAAAAKTETEASARHARQRDIPPPRGSITSPAAFVKAVSTTNRGDLSTILSALGGEEAKWDAMFTTNGDKLKAAGVERKERRYFLWALEKYRQGGEPSAFVVDKKPKKKVRGWGPRVQKGIRVRGRRRPGEK